MEKRETRYRVQWYYRLFEETQKGLKWGTSVEVVHGSLLALGELLRHTGRQHVGKSHSHRDSTETDAERDTNRNRSRSRSRYRNRHKNNDDHRVTQTPQVAVQ